MENLSGCLTAKLADRDENYENHLIEEINSRIRPPRPISQADVYIRAMYIVSDQINSQGGCFAEEELDHLSELLIDSPVMVGHQRDSLPLARNFMARRIEIDGRPWVKSYFYWMKEGEGSEDLKNNIDGGIYKECSISFLFNLPECSICGRDIRECRHVPFHEYEVESGRQEIAHFKYRNIEKVMETSLVFRGAIPDTRITDKLSIEDENIDRCQSIAATHFFQISEKAEPNREHHTYRNAPMSFHGVHEFSPDDSIVSLHLSPYQPGICLRISKNDENIDLESSQLLPDKVRQYLTDVITENLSGSFKIDALLYAVKGKQRRSGLGLMRVLESGRQLHRLRLKICDIIELKGSQIIEDNYLERRKKWQEAFKNTDLQNIELRIFRTCTRQDWNPNIVLRDCSRYNFGYEVLAEDNKGLLTRHIITVDKLIPVVIRETSRSGRGQMKCSLRTIGENQDISGVICPANTGLDKGAAALIIRQPSGGGKQRFVWSLADILPGSEENQIEQPRRPSNEVSESMYIVRDRNRIRLYLDVSGHWQEILVHHFSAHLFKQGRRFIADLTSCDDDLCVGNNAEKIPLKSIVQSGKTILIRPAKLSTDFGDVEGIWLRPILIDGAERFLFHNEKANCPPEGV